MRAFQVLAATAVGAIAIAASAVAVRPSSDAERLGLRSVILGGATIDPATLGLVERACQNCHSERTEWPWYSRIPPASWTVHEDVERARKRFNLSTWESYSPEEKQAILSAAGAAVRTGSMPPRRYTLLHPKAKLSAEERERLYRWTRTERMRLKNGGPG